MRPCVTENRPSERRPPTGPIGFRLGPVACSYVAIDPISDSELELRRRPLCGECPESLIVIAGLRVEMHKAASIVPPERPVPLTERYLSTIQSPLIGEEAGRQLLACPHIQPKLLIIEIENLLDEFIIYVRIPDHR